jgi:hypothetical protein
VARIRAIGVVVALSFGFETWFEPAGGTLITLPGVRLFVRTLRTHPRPAAALPGESGHAA